MVSTHSKEVAQNNSSIPSIEFAFCAFKTGCETHILSDMSISLEAIFGAISILVALPSAIVIIMRLSALRRQQHVLPVFQDRQREFHVSNFARRFPHLTHS